MTKRSRWILLLAAMICLSMVFVSCGSNVSDGKNPPDEDEVLAPDDTGADGNEEETVEEWEPIRETVLYRTITDEWSKYLGYKQPEAPKLVSATPLFRTESDSMVQKRNGAFYEITYKVSAVQKENHQWLVTYAVVVYNVHSAKAVTPVLQYDNDLAVVHSFRYTDSVVEVETVTRIEEVDELGAPVVNYVTEFNYYDATGKKLNAEPLEQSDMTERELNGYHYVVVGDVCYISKEGEILSVCPRGAEREPIKTDLDYGAYGYVFRSDKISVVDEKGALISEYLYSTAYDSARHTVLSNGNLFVRYERACAANESLYTAEDLNGQRTLYSYVTVDVKTGAIRELPVEFRIDRIITNAEDGESDLMLKGDYQYAEITKITDGVLAEKKVPVILDANLKIVKELPLILKNQDSLVRAISESCWLVRLEAENAQGQVIPYFYSVDLSGMVHLYVNVTDSDYRWIEGGFLYEDALYDPMMSLKMSLREETYTVLSNGRLLLGGNKLVYMEEEDATSVVLDELKIATITERMIEEKQLLVSSYEIWNANGVSLVQGDSISLLSTYGDCILVRCQYVDGTAYYYTVR
ncbi:MAG: hypothetical protein IKA76_08560 [Clostridia bacterium]|nr:hypothetical protein [Clostridia bacterium]